MNQEQRQQCKNMIDGLKNPIGAYCSIDGVFLMYQHESEMIADLLQSFLDEIDSQPTQAITLRDQFAIAIAGGFAANTERSALSVESVYEWADVAMKGRGQ